MAQCDHFAFRKKMFRLVSFQCGILRHTAVQVHRKMAVNDGQMTSMVHLSLGADTHSDIFRGPLYHECGADTSTFVKPVVVAVLVVTSLPVGNSYLAQYAWISYGWGTRCVEQSIEQPCLAMIVRPTKR
jgi:hypothetical protein